jgi:hypothetical protein
LPEREVSSLHPSFPPPQAAKGTLQQPWHHLGELLSVYEAESIRYKKKDMLAA